MVTSLLAALVLAASTPAAGDTAPDFTAVDTEGTSHTLSELTRSGKVILAFFPKAFTSGCTKQLEGFRAKQSEVEKSGARVYAVSMDDSKTLKKFKASLQSPNTFLPDPDGKLAKLFDVKMPVVPMASRVTFVIGEGRKVLMVQRGSEAVDPSGAISACALPARKP